MVTRGPNLQHVTVCAVKVCVQTPWEGILITEQTLLRYNDVTKPRRWQLWTIVDVVSALYPYGLTPRRL